MVQPTLRVDPKKPGEDFWYAWMTTATGESPIRRVRSLHDVLEWAESIGVDPRAIEWAGGSYDEMVAAGVAPADPGEAGL